MPSRLALPAFWAAWSGYIRYPGIRSCYWFDLQWNRRSSCRRHRRWPDRCCGIIVGAQVEVIRHGGLQFRVTDGDFIVGAFDVYAWYKGRILRAWQRLGEWAAYFEVLVYVPFHEQGRQKVDVTVMAAFGFAGDVFIGIISTPGIGQVGISIRRPDISSTRSVIFWSKRT